MARAKCRLSEGCVAIVVSASGEKQATPKGAQLAKCLTDVKLDYLMEVVSENRRRDAISLVQGMRVVFHQGGAPSLFARTVPGVGCLVAAGYFVAVQGIDAAHVPRELREVTGAIFPDRDLTALVKYRDVRRAPRHLWQLTKEMIGRSPRAGDNYLLMCPGDTGYDQLNEWWRQVV